MAKKKTEKNQEEVAVQEKAQMVVVIYNSGYSDKIFEVAKKLNINGGTFLTAHGMSKFEAEKFFNITIQPEKEIVMILAATNIKAEWV